MGDFFDSLTNVDPLPLWVANPLYGHVSVDEDLGVYSDAEDPSDTEPM